MAISYPLSFPSVAIRHIKWEAKTKVAISESPFTGEQQVVEHEGKWFEAHITLPPLLKISQIDLFQGHIYSPATGLLAIASLVRVPPPSVLSANIEGFIAHVKGR